MMLKAAALYYAIIVALLIGLMSGSVILFAQYNKFETNQFAIQRKLVNNANSGINWLISQKEIQEYQDGTALDLFGHGMDSVEVRGDLWGLFKVVSAKAEFRNLSFAKAALVGLKTDETDQQGLYLADRNRPLSLCGQTLIRGNSYLPKAGVKRAYIEGQSFTGSTLVSGQVNNSSRQLPTFNEKVIDANIELFSITPKSDTLVYWEEIFFGGSVKRSFQENTVSIIPTGALQLTDQASLNGNVRILSSDRVVISSGAKINNIVVYAREIEIQSGFSGRIQVLSTEKILVGSDVELAYPSSLSLLKVGSGREESEIVIEEDAFVSGVLFSNVQKSRGPVVLIEKGAVIQGSVFVEGSVQLKGSVFGDLTCEKFYLKTPSSVYENHLLNATIDARSRSSEFVGSYLFAESGKTQIVQWLN